MSFPFKSSASLQEIFADAAAERDHHRHDRSSQEVTDAPAGQVGPDRRNSPGKLRPSRHRRARLERVGRDDQRPRADRIQVERAHAGQEPGKRVQRRINGGRRERILDSGQASARASNVEHQRRQLHRDDHQRGHHGEVVR